MIKTYILQSGLSFDLIVPERSLFFFFADSQHSEEWKQTLKEHEEKKDRVIEKYKQKCEERKVRKEKLILI